MRVSKVLLVLTIIVSISSMAFAQSAPNPAQGQHLTKKHRTRYVTGRPLFSVPQERTTRIVTYTPEDIHELVVQNHDVEKVGFHAINSAE